MTSIDRRSLIATGMALPLLPRAAVANPHADVPRFPEPAARMRIWPGPELSLDNASLPARITERSTDPIVRDRALDRIEVPFLDIFPAKNPNGAALLITPGGGYARVVMDKEGYELADLLSARGITCFVLFYRLPSEGGAPAPDVPLADAQRAIRLIRANAGKYGIDPKRVAAMGFSAGGHLCADLATRFGHRAYAPVDAADTHDARPCIAAPIYPVVSMDPAIAHAGSRTNLIGESASAAVEAAHSPDRQLSDATPPLFLLHAENDDVVPVENTVRLRAAAKAAGIAVETHLFEEGGHGFGLRFTTGKPVAAWPDLFLAWAARHGLMV